MKIDKSLKLSGATFNNWNFCFTAHRNSLSKKKVIPQLSFQEGNFSLKLKLGRLRSDHQAPCFRVFSTVKPLLWNLPSPNEEWCYPDYRERHYERLCKGKRLDLSEKKIGRLPILKVQMHQLVTLFDNIEKADRAKGDFANGNWQGRWKFRQTFKGHINDNRVSFIRYKECSLKRADIDYRSTSYWSKHLKFRHY